ncbi:hypothetical protein GGI42DRAFT_316000 [Trichoderma sp. SZMC 28013]
MDSIRMEANDLWNHVVATYDPFTIKFAGITAVSLFSWWIPCIGFTCLEYMAPSFSEKHKMQPTSKKVKPKDVLRAAGMALCNDLLSIPMYMALSYAFAGKNHKAVVGVVPDLPTPTEFVLGFVQNLILRETFNYYWHRLAHWKPLYRRFHKVHHEFTAPVAFASKYAHPLEYLTVDSLPVLLPPLILKTHIVTTWAFMYLVLFSSTVIHSGYDFFYEAAYMHDRHHEGAANVYYGSWGQLGMLDWIHGTVEKDRKRRRTKAE